MMTASSDSLAVLSSSGLDSAILLGQALRQGRRIHPLYIRMGLAWEEVELSYLTRFLQTLACPSLQSLQILSLPVNDLYRDHWSLTGIGAPGADTPDEAVFLPGRNVLLLAKAILWCHLRKLPALAMGILSGNPFPDATDGFFARYVAAVNEAVGGSVRLELPLADMKKEKVVSFSEGLPLHLTFSCINPQAGLHCGRCNKCAERRRAFRECAKTDPTSYAGVR